MSSACPQLLLSLTKNTQIHISSMMSINQPKFIFFLSPYLDHSMAGPPTNPPLPFFAKRRKVEEEQLGFLGGVRRWEHICLTPFFHFFFSRKRWNKKGRGKRVRVFASTNSNVLLYLKLINETRMCKGKMWVSANSYLLLHRDWKSFGPMSLVDWTSQLISPYKHVNKLSFESFSWIWICNVPAKAHMFHKVWGAQKEEVTCLSR